MLGFEEEVKGIILTKIRPLLLEDGGDIEFVAVNDAGVVQVRLKGACEHCVSSQFTIQYAVKRTLMTEVPGVTDVISVS